MLLEPKEILGIYKPDAILVTGIRPDTKVKNRFFADFNFPQYELTQGDLGHVSAAQMHTALFQGMFCAIAGAIEENPTEWPIGMEEFFRRRLDCLLKSVQIEYNRKVKPNTTEQLSFYLREARQVFRSRFHAVSAHVGGVDEKHRGFMSGSIECWLPASDVTTTSPPPTAADGS